MAEHKQQSGETAERSRRLRQEIERLGLRAGRISTDIGEVASFIGGYLRRNSVPGIDILRRIEKVSGISADYVWNGVRIVPESRTPYQQIIAGLVEKAIAGIGFEDVVVENVTVEDADDGSVRVTLVAARPFNPPSGRTPE